MARERETVTMMTSVLASWSVGRTTVSPSPEVTGMMEMIVVRDDVPRTDLVDREKVLVTPTMSVKPQEHITFVRDGAPIDSIFL